MMQEQKPKKKKLSITTILGDPGKAVAQLMEDPDIMAKIPEVLAKCPPAAMKVLACSIAQYLPPTKIEVAELTRATTDILRPILKEDIEAPTIIGNAEGLAEIRKQLVQMSSAIKAIQDDLPEQIQAQVSAIVKAEFEAFQKMVVA
jgi:hypothetical protein